MDPRHPSNERMAEPQYKNRSRPGAAKMTRAHFEAIAETLSALRPDRGNLYAPRSVRAKGASAYEQWITTVRMFADKCAACYAGGRGGFDRGRFYRACGMEE